MNFLCVIPARYGSKRVKYKNLKNISGEPLVYWTIKFAKKIKDISNIIVTTDDKDIQKIALKKKVICSNLRPKNLSTDNVKTSDVCFASSI